MVKDAVTRMRDALTLTSLDLVFFAIKGTRWKFGRCILDELPYTKCHR